MASTYLRRVAKENLGIRPDILISVKKVTEENSEQYDIHEFGKTEVD